MSDSTHIIIISNPDSLSYYLDSFSPETRDIVASQIQSETNRANEPSIVPATIVFMLIASVVFFRIRQILLENEEPIRYVQPAKPDCYYYNGCDIDFSDEEYISILKKYSSYYNNLSAALRNKFLDRLKEFLSTKTFRLPKDQTVKEMPVLLSATATQLIFGLDECTLLWFKEININAEEYFADDPHALRVLAGNLDDESITIAWSHFLFGISDAEDGSNVGLHEFAHVLYYQYVVIDAAKERSFINTFNIVMQDIEKIHEASYNAQTLFSAYAFRNTQEFWAKSIEIFFEKPVAMQHQFPFLFNNISTLLNQNPLDKSNPIAILYT